MSPSNIPIVDMKKKGIGFKILYLAYKIAIETMF